MILFFFINSESASCAWVDEKNADRNIAEIVSAFFKRVQLTVYFDASVDFCPLNFLFVVVGPFVAAIDLRSMS